MKRDFYFCDLPALAPSGTAASAAPTTQTEVLAVITPRENHAAWCGGSQCGGQRGGVR